MKRKTQGKPAWQKAEALERALALLESAKREAGRRPELAKRHAGLGLKIAMRYNVRLPAGQKLAVCRSCRMYLLPGTSCRVRISGGKRAVTCLSCGAVARYPISHTGRRLK